jgi:hypothetical protein
MVHRRDGRGFMVRPSPPATARPVNESSVGLSPLNQVSIMPSLQVLPDPGRMAIQSHVCPKCLRPMNLTRTKPSWLGFELRSYAGVNCDHVDRVVVATTSMRWMSSELRAPV